MKKKTANALTKAHQLCVQDHEDLFDHAQKRHQAHMELVEKMEAEFHEHDEGGDVLLNPRNKLIAKIGNALMNTHEEHCNAVDELHRMRCQVAESLTPIDDEF